MEYKIFQSLANSFRIAGARSGMWFLVIAKNIE